MLPIVETLGKMNSLSTETEGRQMTNNQVFQQVIAINIHFEIAQNDLAYECSVKNNDINNMAMVLRAYGKDYGFEAAQTQIEVAKQFI